MRFVVSSAVVLATLVAGALPLGHAQNDTLGPLSRHYLDTSAPAARQSLLQFAADHDHSTEGTLARVAIGLGDYQNRQFTFSLEQLTLAAEMSGDLADYVVFYRALSAAGTGDHAEAARLLADFGKRFPSSALLPGVLNARADNLSQAGQAKQALQLLDSAPRANVFSWMLYGQVAERAGDLAKASQAYQKVYYDFPTSAEQATALAALNTIRPKMAGKYPEPTAAMRLGRADKLLAAQKYQAARAEYKTLSLRLKGLAGEQAAIRMGACDYNLKITLRALRYLRALKVTQPEAAAEKLYYIGACARRLDRSDEFLDAVSQLGKQHRASHWYEEALFAAGNSFLVENTSEKFVTYYRTLADSFPKGRYAAQAQWKVAWQAYVDRKDEAGRLFEEHLRLYPGSSDVTGAIYWLGRLAEGRSDNAAARAWYGYLVSCCPNYYYTLLARERLTTLPGSGDPTPAPASVGRLLAALPSKPAPPASQPPVEWTMSQRRARVLNRLGFTDLADRELRFRAQSEPLAYYAGVELADEASGRESYHQAMRYLKRYTPGYLAYPIESMPRHYWELLFPLPWREQIVSYSKENQLDPFLVAALIRQESEFNPAAISSASARGLMQIRLSTGRLLARNLGIAPVTASALYVPDMSLRLGTLHLRRVIDLYDGRLEPALAGYNAGENRADKWLGWREMQDPAEFVESIPFSETRNYVQSVLRNAEIYRKLYGS